MKGVGKVTNLKLIILLFSFCSKLQFTTQLINRCGLKLKIDVHVPYLSHPHPVTAAKFPPPPCHVLAALLDLYSFGLIMGTTSVRQVVNSWGPQQYLKSASRRAPPPSKITGWLRHTPELQAPHRRTGAPPNKQSMRSPYKPQFFGLVLSGLLV